MSGFTNGNIWSTGDIVTAAKLNAQFTSGSLDLTGHGGNITPDADDTRDLGSSSKEFKDAYIDGTLNVDQIASTLSGTGDLAVLEQDGTGIGVKIQQDGVLAASKYALWVYSNAVQNTSPLVFLEQDNASADQNVLDIQNDGSGVTLNLTTTNTSDSIVITHASGDTGDAINIDYAAQPGTAVIDINMTDATGGTGIDITNQGTGISVDINHASGDTGDSINIDYAAAAAGAVVDINVTGSGTALDIANASTSVCALLTNSGNGPHLRMTGDPTVASPTDGDFWFDGSSAYLRVGAATKNIYPTTQSNAAVGSTSDPTTTSATYIDLTDMSVTITTGANPVLVLFAGDFSHNTTSARVWCILEIDGTDKTTTEAVASFFSSGEGGGERIAITHLETLTAAEHTFKIQWKQADGTGTALGIRRSMQVIELKT